MYVSIDRLDELVGQILSGRGQLTGVGIQALGSGFSLARAGTEERTVFYRNVDAVQKYLKRHRKLGTFDAPKEYFCGDLSMVWIPFEGVKPKVLYFTGATDRTVVALAGPLRRMVGADREEARAGPLQRFIIHEPEVARMVADAQRAAVEEGEQADATLPPPRSASSRWEWDVLDSYQKMAGHGSRLRSKQVTVLAWTDQHSRAEDLTDVLPEPKNVLLGKPVWVAEPS